MEKQSLFQKHSVTYLIINIVFILPVFIMLNLPNLGYVNQFYPLIVYVIPLGYYCILKLTYFHIILSIVLLICYIHIFLRHKMCIHSFLLSLFCVAGTIGLNSFLIINADRFTVQQNENIICLFVRHFNINLTDFPVMIPCNVILCYN